MFNERTKKIIKIVGIVFTVLMIILIGIVVFMINGQGNKDNQTIKQKQSNNTEAPIKLPKVECNYKNDKEAYGKAITKKDIGICSCIKETSFNDTCRDAVMGIMLYDQALSQLDESLCEEIKSEVQKDSCYKVVKSSIAKLEKDNPEYLARVYASAHSEEAIGVLENIINEDQQNINAYITLALSYAEKGLKEQEQGRDQTPYVQKALNTIEQAKQIDNKNSEVYRAEGYAYEIKPDYNQARASYQKALELDPNNVLAHSGLGHVYRMEGVLEAAVEEFQKAAELDTQKQYITIYTNLCNLEYSRSNYQKAIKNCKTITQMENTDPVFQSEAYQTMAKIFTDKKDLQQARNYLLKAKTLTPNDPNLLVSFAELNLAEEKYKKAEEDAKKAIELSPTKAVSYLKLAYALYMQEKYNEAIEKAQKGITLVKTDVSLLMPNKPAVARDLNYAIANSYRQLGNTQKEQEYNQKAKDAFENINQITE